VKLLITGGTGFFGKSLLKYWQTKGLFRQGTSNSVTILSRNSHNFIKLNSDFLTNLNVDFIEGNISNFDNLPTKKFTHMIHAAAESTNGPKISKEDVFQQIIIGTQNALDFAVKSEVKSFLFISSGGIYGTNSERNTPIKETDYVGQLDPTNLTNTYSISKLAAENLVSIYAKENKLAVKIARCFAFVGEDLPTTAHFAVGNFIEDAKRGRDIIINGNGLAFRSYLYQSELAEWLFEILTRGKIGDVYNVGSETPYSILEIAHIVKKVINNNINVIIKNSEDSDLKSFYVPDTSNARSKLGLNQKFDIIESIQKTILNMKC
jgi:UDP-glucuronate decarboxylase